MSLYDINRTLQAPFDYQFDNIHADGAFLVITYFQHQFHPSTRELNGTNWIHIWLNDQGREVVRTDDLIPVPPKPVFNFEPVRIPRTRWQQFWFDTGKWWAVASGRAQ